MLRITSLASHSITTLSLEGKLLAPWITELRTAAAAALARGPVQLDLAALTFADGEGIEALRALQRAGIRIERDSPFIHSLLSVAEAAHEQ
jgi:hypothetical protein